MLSGQKHHCRLLQKSFDEWGLTAFRLEFIEVCLPEQLLERERYWIATLRPALNGYGAIGDQIEASPLPNRSHATVPLPKINLKAARRFARFERRIGFLELLKNAPAKEVLAALDPDSEPLPTLSRRQGLALKLKSMGLSNDEIGKVIGIKHRSNVSRLLGRARRSGKALFGAARTLKKIRRLP